ncbi:transglycosylase SLT domain-containing protein [Nocardia sp. NPDC127579]|uniref:transglycosylase SLT domain-containing protein n=1 Tax=Nocardia sp. NPDC127579 TaxID=3345402 RepID=UPI00363F3C1B
MEINVEGLKLLAGAQSAAALALADSAGRLRSAASEFVPAQVGREYLRYGEQIVTAMETIGQQVTAWADTLEQTGQNWLTSANAMAAGDNSFAATLQALTQGESPSSELTSNAPSSEAPTDNPEYSNEAPTTMPSGEQKDWIDEAIRELRAAGYDIKDSDAAIIAKIIEKESGGNPNAINNWDSNAAAGTPSKGLMQTIDPTFNSYKLPGHDDIYNPVDNIIAGTRYAIERYGSLSNVPGIVAMNSGNSYVGY